MTRPAKIGNISRYFRVAPISPLFRARIGRDFRAEMQRVGVGRNGNGTIPCNQQTREIVADAIFRAENELETRQPGHPQVTIMRKIRHRIYIDLGWDDP